MTGDIHMEVSEVDRRTLRRDMWLLPPYDHETGLTPDEKVPIPERIHAVVHVANPDMTAVTTYDTYRIKHEYVFTDDDPKPEIVL
jgi:hypothetical protein